MIDLHSHILPYWDDGSDSWATSLSMLREAATRNLILLAMVSFLGILFVGYLYAVKKKAFDWKS